MKSWQKTLKQIWTAGEHLVAEQYIHDGYNLVQANYTIRGGEIDLIMQSGETLVFIEVKVVNLIEELDEYITPHKIKAMRRSIEQYVQDSWWSGEVRVDVVFVKHEQIIEQIEDIDF